MSHDGAEAHQHLVLVVEDDQDLRDIVADVLTAHGYRTASAIHGEDALEKLHDGEKPCVILLDLMMPVMDGWAFRARQREDPELSRIPVVVLTAHASASQVGTELAATEFLAKPVALHALLATVARVCEDERLR